MDNVLIITKMHQLKDSNCRIAVKKIRPNDILPT